MKFLGQERAQTVAEIAGPRLAEIRKFEQVNIHINAAFYGLNNEFNVYERF